MINENVCASCGRDKEGVQGKSLYCKACNNEVEEMSARIADGVGESQPRRIGSKKEKR